MNAFLSIARLLFCAFVLAELLAVSASRASARERKDEARAGALAVFANFLAHLFVAVFAAVLKGAAR